jgi:phosphatidylethanolamine-binding protein (PEBP) family uncharacterized protein
MWYLIEMVRSRIKKRRMKKRSKTRRIRRQRGGNVTDIAANTGAPPFPGQTNVKLDVRFLPNSVFSATEFGNTLTKMNSSSMPKVEWVPPSAGTLYTFLCWDPDAEHGGWLHWLVINCQGKDPTTGETIVKWQKPSPPTGEHRYIFIVFQQANKITMEPNDNRAFFKIAEFTQAHSLTPVSHYKGIRVKS